MSGTAEFEEEARTGRSKCRVCSECIKAGTFRVGYTLFLNGHAGTVWQHPGCFLKNLELSLAPSNRGECKDTGCTEGKMNKDCVRLGYTIGENKKWHHLRCGFLGIESHLSKFGLPSPSAVKGFDTLSAENQDKVKRRWNGLALPEDDATGTVSAEEPKKKKTLKKKASEEVGAESIADGELGGSEGSGEVVKEKAKRRKLPKLGEHCLLAPKVFVPRDNRFKGKLDMKAVVGKKLLVLNVNGLRAATLNRGLKAYLVAEKADIIFLSEVKCEQGESDIDFRALGYDYIFWNSSQHKGRAGTAIISKVPVDSVKFGGLGICDDDGRLLTADFATFYLVGAYVPNSGEELKTSEQRKEWDAAFRPFLHELETRKPVLWCGDMNVAHQMWDVYDGPTNRKRVETAGFTLYEREAFDTIIQTDGFIDAYRHFTPEEKVNHFTYFAFRKKMKDKNKGWRLDYCVISPELLPFVASCEIRNDVIVSDHLPIVVNFVAASSSPSSSSSSSSSDGGSAKH